jgi:hypothetical protein
MEHEAADYLSISQVCRMLPPSRAGTPIHAATAIRWILSGCRAADGSRVRLAALRYGSRWLITRGALETFLRACAAGVADAPIVMPRTSGQRRRAAERAGEQLTSMGI